MFTRIGLLAVLLVLSATSRSASAVVKTQGVDYTVGGARYIGFLAYDDAQAEKVPGILIAPEWIGLNDYSRDRAKQLAGMGYVAFVFDPYGDGKNAADVKQAAEWSGALKANRPELRARINAAFETLKKQERVDPKKTAAIGYCFGGTTVLELARSGADVLGVVSFHGGLAAPIPAKVGELKARILVCHGADDPFVKPEEVAGFEKEMREAKADWQLISYGNAVHSFTNPAAKGQMPGAQYNELADKRSWEAMRASFAELFGPKEPHAPGTTGPSFGSRRHIVFVAHITNEKALAECKAELTRAIENLRPNQPFNIIGTDNAGKIASPWKGVLLGGTAENKKIALQFVADMALTQDDTLLAMVKPAFAMEGDLTYFLTGTAAPDKGFPSAVAQAATGLKSKVNVIMFGDRPVGAEEVLKKVATDNRGKFIIVREGRDVPPR